MAVADLTRIQKRVVQLLNARPSDINYATTPSGRNSAYAGSQELADAILEADAMVVMDGYLSVPNHPQRQQFLVVSGNLANGAQVPLCVGVISRVDVTNDSGSNWTPAIESTKDDVLMGRSLNAATIPYIASDAMRGFYAIADDSIYHTDQLARIYLPQFTKTAVCQAHEGHEAAIIAGAMMLLKKDNSNAEHEFYANQYFQLLPLIRQGATQVMKGQ